MYIDANNTYGCSMSHLLPYDENKFQEIFTLEGISNSPNGSDMGYFVEVDLKYPDNIKEKTKKLTFAAKNNVSPHQKFTKQMNDFKPDVYTKNKKLICDWTDEKKYLVHWGMLKFFVGHGKVVDRDHEVISFKQIRWFKKIYVLLLKKRN